MLFSKNKNRKLVNYLINKEVQLKLFAANLFYIFLVVIITVAVIILPVIGIMFKPGSSEAQYYATMIYLNITAKLPLAIIAVVILFAINHIFLSHRICGPLVNFRNTFRKIACGDFTRKIKLREKDFFKSDADEINKMIDNLSQIIYSVKKEHAELSSAARNISFANREKTIEDITKINTIAKNISQKLSIFNLPETGSENRPNNS